MGLVRRKRYQRFYGKSVTDQSITNVLMLLDPIYTEKADGRRGGVGIETQIISSEVYGRLFEKELNGFVAKL